jgi:hypothetical protein
MNVYILDAATLVPSVVTDGFVLRLGRDGYEILFLCDGATHSEAVHFQQQFCRKTNWLVRDQIMSIAVYNEIIRTRYGAKASEKAPMVERRRHHLS